MPVQEFTSTPQTEPQVGKPVAPALVFDENKRLTYESARAVVERGGSVMIGSVNISDIAKFPSAIQYAKANGDQTSLAKASTDQQAEIDRLTSELKAAKESVKTSAEAKRLADEKAAVEKKAADEEAAKKAPAK